MNDKRKQTVTKHEAAKRNARNARRRYLYAKRALREAVCHLTFHSGHGDVLNFVGRGPDAVAVVRVKDSRGRVAAKLRFDVLCYDPAKRTLSIARNETGVDFIRYFESPGVYIDISRAEPFLCVAWHVQILFDHLRLRDVTPGSAHARWRLLCDVVREWRKASGLPKVTLV